MKAAHDRVDRDCDIPISGHSDELAMKWETFNAAEVMTTELARRQKLVKTKHQKEPVVTCDICNHRYQSQSRHARHQLQHFRTQLFQCAECLRTFRSRNNLIKHIRAVHLDVSRRSQQCPLCHKFVLDLPEHLVRHSSRRFACELCPLRFSKPSYYRDHLASVHPSAVGSSLLACPLCRRLFARSSNLSEHLRRHEINRDENGHYRPMRPRGKGHAKYADSGGDGGVDSGCARSVAISDQLTCSSASVVSIGTQTGCSAGIQIECGASRLVSTGNRTGCHISVPVANLDQITPDVIATDVSDTSKVSRLWEQALHSSQATDMSDFDYFLKLLADRTK